MLVCALAWEAALLLLLLWKQEHTNPQRASLIVSIDRLCTNKVNGAFVPSDVAEGVGFACSKFIFFS